MSSVSELEAEAAVTRERLNATIGAIQDRLSLTGMVNEVMGQTGVTGFDGGKGAMQDLIRRFPVPIMIAAAGVGFWIYRSNRRARAVEGDIMPVTSVSRQRRYDPDQPLGRPRLDAVDGRDPVGA